MSPPPHFPPTHMLVREKMRSGLGWSWNVHLASCDTWLFCLCASLLVCRWCSALPCMLWAELCGSRLGCFSCTKTLGMVRANPHHTLFVFRRTASPKCTGTLPLCSSGGIYFLLVIMHHALHSWLDLYFLFLFFFYWLPPPHPPRTSLVNGNTGLTNTPQNEPFMLGCEHLAGHYFSADYSDDSDTSQMSSLPHLMRCFCLH